MLLRHLRYFTVLAREKHFARAARTCNVSQPTISGAIATLEREFGVRLVIRGRRFLELTPEGRLVLDEAHLLLAGEDNLRLGLQSLRGGLSGVLRLGVIPAALPAVGLLIDTFCAKHPAVAVELRSMSSRSIQASLDTFEIDAGITYLDNEPLTQVRSILLYSERYLLATAADGALGARDWISWREAASLRLCLLSEDMQNRRILDSIFGMQSLDPYPAVVSNSFLAILSQMRTGSWSSIIPDTFAQIFGEQRNIALIPLVEPAHTQAIGLVTTDRDMQPPMARALEACARSIDFVAALEL
jgi:DNA-binding transcriptional LysR family regulator